MTAKEITEIEARVKSSKALPWNADVDVVALCDEVRRLWKALDQIANGEGECQVEYTCWVIARRYVPDDYEEQEETP